MGVHPDTGLYDRRQERPLRSATSPGCCPRTRQKTPSAHRLAALQSMSLDTIALDDAVKLLSLPRVVGVAQRTARRSPPRTAATGPYLKKGTDIRSTRRARTSC